MQRNYAMMCKEVLPASSGGYWYYYCYRYCCYYYYYYGKIWVSDICRIDNWYNGRPRMMTKHTKRYARTAIQTRAWFLHTGIIVYQPEEWIIRNRLWPAALRSLLRSFATTADLSHPETIQRNSANQKHHTFKTTQLQLDTANHDASTRSNDFIPKHNPEPCCQRRWSGQHLIVKNPFKLRSNNATEILTTVRKYCLVVCSLFASQEHWNIHHPYSRPAQRRYRVDRDGGY